MNLLKLTEQKVNIGIAIMFVLTLYSNYLVIVMGNKIEDLSVKLENAELEVMLEYPMNVIEYGLQDATTDEQVQNQITTWINDKWGAQIGALETVCDNDISKLNSLMSEELAREVCRRV